MWPVLRPALQFVRDAMSGEAYSNRFDSAKDLFKNLPLWDGVVRAGRVVHRSFWS